MYSVISILLFIKLDVNPNNVIAFGVKYCIFNKLFVIRKHVLFVDELKLHFSCHNFVMKIFSSVSV